MWSWWCLLQGGWDRRAEEGEGPLLHWAWRCDLVDLVASDGDGVAVEGGEVVEEVAEAAGWLAAGGDVPGGLGLG